MLLKTWLRTSLVALALVGAASQPSPAQTPVGGGDQVYSSWAPTGRASLTAGTGSTRVALGSGAPVAWVCNTGAVTAYVALGSNTVVVTVANGFPILAGGCSALNAVGKTNLAGITVSSTAPLVISTGSGNPNSIGSGGAAGTVTGEVTADQGAAGSAAWLVIKSSQYPSGATPITASSTGTTGATTATLAANATKTTYICGFSIRSNATAAATGDATVTGPVTGTLHFNHFTAPLASGMGVTEETFSVCVPGSAVNTGIAVASPAPGSGGTVSVSAWGYQL